VTEAKKKMDKWTIVRTLVSFKGTKRDKIVAKRSRIERTSGKPLNCTPLN
jgi:hypothetical protein